jgi:uncharacterized membrane protein
MSGGLSEGLEARLLHRLLFFTDAVFAIALTLLVLELRPPQHGAAAQGAAGLQAMNGHLAAFAMSFALIAIFWAAHMNTTRRLVRFDWLSVLANVAFLFPVCLIPFVSAWLGGALDSAFAWTLYASVLVATSLGNVLLILVSSRDRGRLVGGITPRERLYYVSRASSPGLAFLLTLLLLGAGQLAWARFCFLLIPAFLLLEARFLRPPRVVSARPAAGPAKAPRRGR